MAESFGADAERYDRARAAYPAEMIARIVAAAPGRRFLDVGCGTGIEGRQLGKEGCDVLGVEPDERMAEVARRSFPVEVSTFEAWEPAGRTFDAVVSGMAWHWIDPVAGAAQAAGVLEPGGRVTLFWHTFTLPPALTDALAAAYGRLVPDFPFVFTAGRQGPEAYQPILTRAADGLRGTGAFGPVEQWRYDWERVYTRQAWAEHLPTTGGAARLPAGVLAEIVARTGAVVDAMGGSFTMGYATVAVTAARV